MLVGQGYADDGKKAEVISNGTANVVVEKSYRCSGCECSLNKLSDENGIGEVIPPVNKTDSQARLRRAGY